MTHDAAFLHAIVDAQPGQARWFAMRIYADYLEERGREEAIGWRWLAKRKKWPFHMTNGVPYYRWWYETRGVKLLRHYDLPTTLWDELPAECLGLSRAPTNDLKKILCLTVETIVRWKKGKRS